MRSSRDKARSNPDSTAWLREAMAQQHKMFARQKARGTYPFLMSNQDTSQQDTPEQETNKLASREIDETEFTYLRKLDEGTFGVAYLAEWKKEIIVVKEFKLDVMMIIDCEDEREAMQMLTDLRAPNMLNILGYSQSSLHYSIAMPYMENGSLANYMDKQEDPLSWRMTYRVIKDFVCAIEFLHRNNMVHGDVKDTNIFLDSNMRAYLADFGVTRVVDDYIWDDINILWRAPEALYESYIQSTEMYSVAVVMWQLVNWDMPFSSCDDNKKIARFVGKGGRLDIDENCPPLLAKWIKKCWHHEPEKRMTATELLGGLESAGKRTRKRAKISLSEPDLPVLSCRKSI